MKIILASASPRRRELLEQIGIEFEIKISEVEEVVTSTKPEEVVKELSGQKAQAVFDVLEKEMKEDYLVVGADTIVFADGEILGKPKDYEDCKRMLRLLQNNIHQVFTGVTLIWKEQGKTCKTSFAEATDVRVCSMDEDEIKAYIETGEPMDKAGGYGIQGFFARYVEGIDGDYNNVVGLPVARLYKEMKGMLKK